MATEPAVQVKELRKFGVLMAVFVPIVLIYILPKVMVINATAAAIGMAATFAGLALVKPVSLERLYLAWIKLGNLLGRINTKILLTLIYFLFLVPYALVLRLFGRQVLRLKFEADAKTYKIYTENSRPITHLEKPY